MWDGMGRFLFWSRCIGTLVSKTSTRIRKVRQEDVNGQKGLKEGKGKGEGLDTKVTRVL